MPLTPFHFGPGLLMQETRPQFFSFTVFILSQIIMDFESLYNILNHNERIHTYFHTYIGSVIPFLITILLYAVYKKYFMRMDVKPASFLGIVASAWIGVWSHVFLDSIMHSDMQPFWPISVDNSMQGFIGLESLHLICLICLIIGLGLYLNRKHFIHH